MTEEPFAIEPEQLREVGILRGFSDSELLTLSRYFTAQTHPPLKVKVEENTPGASMYILLKGSAEVYCRSQHRQRLPTRRLNPGDVFGEIALLDQEPRSASVETVTACVFAEFTAAALQEVMRDHPTLAVRLLHNLACNLAADVRDLTKRMRNFFDQEATLRSLQ